MTISKWLSLKPESEMIEERMTLQEASQMWLRNPVACIKVNLF